MWCLVMFDLPVETKKQRKRATQFRKLLLDMGYGMIQFSVYARYTPTLGGNRATVKAIHERLPPQGKVRILHVTDNQWASADRFSNQEPESEVEKPEMLTLF